MRRPLLRYLFAVISLSMLAGCFCIPNVDGGYAEPCDFESLEGWERGKYGTLLAYSLHGRELHFSTRYLYHLNEPVKAFQLSAYFGGRGGSPAIYYSPQDAYIEIGSRRIAAHPVLRESPFHSRKCNGTFPSTASLSDCGSPVVTFPMAATVPRRFRVHYGSFVVDGETIPIPDIEFCYRPKRFNGWGCYRG